MGQQNVRGNLGEEFCQMRGYVTGFDAFTVVLTSDGKQQVIYKHAISTIVPERPVPLCQPGELE